MNIENHWSRAIQNIYKVWSQGEEIVQWLETLTPFASYRYKIWVWFSPHTGHSIFNFTYRGFDTLFWFLLLLYTHGAHIYSQYKYIANTKTATATTKNTKHSNTGNKVINIPNLYETAMLLILSKLGSESWILCRSIQWCIASLENIWKFI